MRWCVTAVRRRRWELTRTFCVRQVKQLKCLLKVVVPSNEKTRRSATDGSESNERHLSPIFRWYIHRPIQNGSLNSHQSLPVISVSAAHPSAGKSHTTTERIVVLHWCIIQNIGEFNRTVQLTMAWTGTSRRKRGIYYYCSRATTGFLAVVMGGNVPWTPVLRWLLILLPGTRWPSQWGWAFNACLEMSLHVIVQWWCSTQLPKQCAVSYINTMCHGFAVRKTNIGCATVQSANILSSYDQ